MIISNIMVIFFLTIISTPSVRFLGVILSYLNHFFLVMQSKSRMDYEISISLIIPTIHRSNCHHHTSSMGISKSIKSKYVVYMSRNLRWHICVKYACVSMGVFHTCDLSVLLIQLSRAHVSDLVPFELLKALHAMKIRLGL